MRNTPKYVIKIKVVRNEYGIDLAEKDQYTMFASNGISWEPTWGTDYDSIKFTSIEKAKEFFTAHKAVLINRTILKIADLTTLAIHRVEYTEVEKISL